MEITRRSFLRRASLLSVAPAVPGFLARTAQAVQPERDARVLVVVQLDGGNDGINTVVPFRDDGYGRHRQRLRLNPRQLIQVNDHLGLHPGLRDLGNLLESGQLAVIQGVGYPNSNFSHDGSMAIWQSARFERGQQTLGWIGRGLDGAATARNGTSQIFVGLEAMPVALRGRTSRGSAVARFEDFTATPPPEMRGAVAGSESRDDLTAFVRRSLLDGYTTADAIRTLASPRDNQSYPPTELADRLQLVARLLKADTPTRVFYTLQRGYDTHGQQLGQHDLLLRTLAGALRAFFDDLRQARSADRVCVLVFSEFGRRVAENGSAGTDHGSAGPVFLVGPSVRGGVVGATPSLLDLQNGNLRVGMDFRRVYATLLQDWLGLASNAALGGDFERLPLFRV